MGTANILNNYKNISPGKVQMYETVCVCDGESGHSLSFSEAWCISHSFTPTENSNFTLYIQIKGNVSHSPVLKVVFLILQNSNFVLEDHQQDFSQEWAVRAGEAFSADLNILRKVVFFCKHVNKNYFYSYHYLFCLCHIMSILCCFQCCLLW